jgi:ferredoxin-NADP reductase
MKLIYQGTQAQAEAVHSFTFQPVEPIKWLAGQSIKIEVPGVYGPLEHRFTIASAPYEQVITITTRLSGSEYKNSLASLKPGQLVDAYSIEGDFTWRESPVPHIFVAAGIGITPFHSMLKQRFYENRLLNASLIYASRHLVYKDQLEHWAAQDPSFKLVFITDRRLNPKDIPNSAGYIYLSGPSLMVDKLSAALIKRGVLESQLVRDWFTGRLAEG